MKHSFGSSLVHMYLGWVKDGEKEGRYASKHLLWTEEEKIDKAEDYSVKPQFCKTGVKRSAIADIN